MELTEKQEKERCQIIFGDIKNNYLCRIERFSGISLSAVKKLVEKGYLELEGKQNDAPSVKEFLEFMEKWENVSSIVIMAHGYMVSREREDCRVTLEGLEFVFCDGGTQEFLKDWKENFRDADEFEMNLKKGRCWWD